MDTTPDTEVDEPLLAAAEGLLDIVDELGWNQPARIALLNECTEPLENSIGTAIAGGDRLTMGWPTALEGHPCPALAELGAQTDAAAALLAVEGWIDATSLPALEGPTAGCAEHVTVDGRLEIRTVIGINRDDMRVQITQPRGGESFPTTGTMGRVPDALAMTIGIDADATDIRCEDVLRRAWLTIAAINAAHHLTAANEPAAEADATFDHLRDRIATTGLADLHDCLRGAPFTRLARLIARSLNSTDEDATWKRLAIRLRKESAETEPMLGWALSAAVEPHLLQRWNPTSERRARRWAGPGMVAHIADAGYPDWSDIDELFGEITPRTRTYLKLLPNIDDIVADLAGNQR